jgi:HTH-type transcriptional regulator/antitoxin HigA
MSSTLEEVTRVWPLINRALTPPHDVDEYHRLVALLDEVTDLVGEDESHPLASLMETMGTLVESYESQNVLEPESDPIQALQTLMDEHGLGQSDLPEIGSQGVVSEVLSGKRRLNVRQIKALSQRFNVSPAVFV